MNPLSRQNQHWPVIIIAGITFTSGLLAILEVVYVRFSNRLEALLPFNYEALSRHLGLVAGFTLIYFSGRLMARKRLAWYIAIIGSAVIVIDQAVYARSFAALVLPSVSLVLLAIYRDRFQVRSEPISIGQGLRLFAISLASALAYGTIGFYFLLRRDFGQDFGLIDSAIRTIREYSLIGNDDLVARTRQAQWFLRSLDLFGITAFAFAMGSLFRPLTYRYATLPAERERARAILERFGHSSEDAFKLWPEDKAFYFSAAGDCFIAYRVASGAALALGEAVGPVTAIPEFIDSFQTFCHYHDWTVAFIYLSPERLPFYEAAGMRSFLIGEDAVVELAKFTAETARDKHFRGVRNKFERLGYSFAVSEPPQSMGVLREAANVTRSWLLQPGRTERSFALGYHDRAYLARSRLYLVRDKSGRLVAFANAIHSYNPIQATIDLMRFRIDSETGTMDFLFLSLMEHLAQAGWSEFSLGLAPLSGLSSSTELTVEERVIVRLSQISFGRFAFEGLRRYKSKFRPRWEARYLLYERGASGLGLSAIALSQVTKVKSIDKP